MDGSTASLIIIPIVVVISLAAWLIMVAYAASHPEWKHGPASPPSARIPPPRTEIPLPRAEVPGPVRRPTETGPKVTAGHAGR